MSPKLRSEDEEDERRRVAAANRRGRLQDNFKVALEELFDAGATQFEVARMCGVRVTEISKWKRATQYLSSYDLPELAKLEPLTLLFRTECRARGGEPWTEEADLV